MRREFDSFEKQGTVRMKYGTGIHHIRKQNCCLTNLNDFLSLGAG